MNDQRQSANAVFPIQGTSVWTRLCATCHGAIGAARIATTSDCIPKCSKVGLFWVEELDCKSEFLVAYSGFFPSYRMGARSQTRRRVRAADGRAKGDGGLLAAMAAVVVPGAAASGQCRTLRGSVCAEETMRQVLKVGVFLACVNSVGGRDCSFFCSSFFMLIYYYSAGFARTSSSIRRVAACISITG